MEDAMVIIPVKNEESGLRFLLRDLRISQLHDRFRLKFILVIDSNTCDSSKDVAQQFLGEIIHQTGSVGKGAAISLALKRWKEEPTSMVVFLDADGSYSFNSVEKVIEKLRDGVDIVSGSRFLSKRGKLSEMSLTHHIGNKFLSFVSSVKNKRKITDLCTGLWGFRADALDEMAIKSKGFDLEAEIFGLCRRHDLSHAEVGVDWSQRKGGVSKLRSFRDGIVIFRRILIT